LFVQHACPWPPQLPQLPLEQLPVKTGHVWPLTIQVLFTQQPPLAHVVAAQHTSPGPPQAVHTSLRQTVLALQAVPVVQQAWPAPPQLECELQASQSNAAQNTAARKPSRVMVNLVRLARAAANSSAQCGYSSSRRSRQTRSADASSPVPRIISIPHPKRGSAKPKVTPARGMSDRVSTERIRIQRAGNRKPERARRELNPPPSDSKNGNINRADGRRCWIVLQVQEFVHRK